MSMAYKLLGRSGLRVSELCLGCGTFGTNWGPIGSDKEGSRKVFDAFVEAGGNFIDTSNRYQESQSEEFLGDFIHPNRDRLVLATKYSLFDGFADPNDPNGQGNHRKNMFRSVEGSLKRLKTDYIDLLWIHMWDGTTPVEEILRGLDDLVRQGKVLYVGASNFPAWWIARANTIADFQGWSPFVATQLEYSILERSCEPEFFPMARELDVGVVAWSALGGGMVTGKYNRDKLDPNEPHRLVPHVKETDNFWYEMTRRNMAIMDEVIKVADEIGRPPVQIALRFLMQQDVVSIPIFSARTLAQAQEDLGCLDFVLTDEQMQNIDKATAPAISSVMPESGPYPYPMLEYGTPALVGFYSRALLFGNVEYKIVNHRRIFTNKFQPEPAKSDE
jgi:aryl-alcohol dehydrogenase-like predicted oxidoreductase